ncbi:NAD-dependent dehydratase [Pandoraea terrae]|uniref:NAD-dependent dehydratase n=1 Tax=Pandoraea terrae TaxID=1537710 RepID=A0A5E4UWQ6_9BURK|nr:complex I NDUFA9 subunit family protein [Pandoraea terrae]VVE04377.1 NAD-dependent dehydratase [Pandoraea terrae]
MPYILCVIGGSGFIGAHLVSKLAAAGHVVRVPTRRAEAAKALGVLPGVDLIECNVHDPSALAGVVAGCDVVVNLVGILHGDPGTPYGDAFKRAHVELPRRIAEAAAAAGVARFLHMSALGADPQGPSMYLRSKGDGENAARSTNVPVTIFRPSVVFGPDDHFLNTFARLQRRLPFVPLAKADARFQPIYVGDVAQVFVNALGDDRTVGRAYALGGPRVYTLAELVRFAGAACGCERPIIPLSDAAARMQAALFERLPGEPVITRDNLDSMSVDSVLDGPVAPELHLEPQGLEIAADYLSGAGWLRRLAGYRTYAGR